MAKRTETNEQFVARLMKFSRHGALAQAFILEGITKYAEACAKADPASLDSPFLSGEAWVACAKEIKAETDARFAPRA